MARNVASILTNRKVWRGESISDWYVRPIQSPFTTPEREALQAHWKQFGREALERNAPGSHTEAEWRKVQRRQHSRCAVCNEQAPLTKDHITPLSKGGSDYISNIQGLCHVCNGKKGNTITTTAQLHML